MQKRYTTHNLLSKGVYTEATRNLIHLLVKAGCSRGYVGEVIHAVLKSAGITAVGNISRTTVSRIITEGYYAAQIQLAHEMQNAESMTFSADGTCHRNVNYNACHINLKAESYESNNGADGKCHVTCFFCIYSALDATSEQAMKDWDRCLGNIVDIYNCSPFGKRTGNFQHTMDILK